MSNLKMYNTVLLLPMKPGIIYLLEPSVTKIIGKGTHPFLLGLSPFQIKVMAYKTININSISVLVRQWTLAISVNSIVHVYLATTNYINYSWIKSKRVLGLTVF